MKYNIKREKEQRTRAEECFYAAEAIYLKCLTCLGRHLQTKLITLHNASESGWLTTSALKTLPGKTLQWVGNRNHNNSTLSSKHSWAIIHPQTSVSPLCDAVI